MLILMPQQKKWRSVLIFDNCLIEKKINFFFTLTSLKKHRLVKSIYIFFLLEISHNCKTIKKKIENHMFEFFAFLHIAFLQMFSLGVKLRESCGAVRHPAWQKWRHRSLAPCCVSTIAMIQRISMLMSDDLDQSRIKIIRWIHFIVLES